MPNINPSIMFVLHNVENIVGKGGNAILIGIFSSPEHEVLMVSYCAVSGVRRPSSTFYLVYALEATVLVRYS